MAERTDAITGLLYAGTMTKSTIWSILGAILALVIAWWIVSALFSLLWFVAKLALVVVVALVVYAGIRALTRDARS